MIYSSFITKEKTAEILGVSVLEVEKLMDSDEIEFIVLNDGEVRILLKSVIEYKRQQDC